MYSQAHGLLTDSTFDWSTRLFRLTGWRGDQVAAASASGWRLRLAPAFCAVASVTLGVIGEPLLLGVLAATAAVGAVRGNHVVEELYNATLGRRGASIPKARAARAFGCAIGAVMLFASALAFAAGLPAVGVTLALVMGGVAAFVAISNICIPSVMFISLFGLRRSTEGSLLTALAPGRPVGAETRR